jgi:hypothetical protein
MQCKINLLPSGSRRSYIKKNFILRKSLVKDLTTAKLVQSLLEIITDFFFNIPSVSGNTIIFYILIIKNEFL